VERELRERIWRSAGEEFQEYAERHRKQKGAGHDEFWQIF
jgi:hypothetical protein